MEKTGGKIFLLHEFSNIARIKNCQKVKPDEVDELRKPPQPDGIHIVERTEQVN